MRNRRIKKILGAMLAAAIVCQTSASPGVLTVRAETADSVTADSPTADSSAADSAVDEQEQIRHGDMDENTGAEEDVDVNQGVDVEVAIGGTEEKAADAVAESATEAEYRYISDMEYITDNRWSYAGWGNIMKDKNIEGGTISLLLDGSRVYFKKGMGAHATSQLTYDISAYSDVYTRFVAKMGVDAERGGNGEVWFRISVSKDGTNWEELYKSGVVTSASNAIEVDLNVKGYRYLRLYSDSNGSNGADHSVYADARIVKTDYDMSSELIQDIRPTAYYDEQLSQNTVKENYSNQLYTVLKREFVNRMGYWTLQSAIKDDADGEVLEAIRWIFNNKENLQLFIETGNVGDSQACLKLLGSLYKNQKEDLDKADGDIYKKMMIALAISYSTDRNGSPLSFNSPANSYDINERYEILKELYDTELFVRKAEFSSYHMELIRMVVNDSTANSEIKWLRGYSESKYPNNLEKRLNPYNYMKYISPNYHQDRLYAQENYAAYNDKYKLEQYGIPYGLNSDGSKTEKTWMVMEAGGICWNISRLGSNLHRVHGIPSVGVYQPAHESYLTYSVNADGKGVWDIGNNIFGWGQSSTTWYGGNGNRLLFDWNNKSFTRKHMGIDMDLGNGNKSSVGNNGGYQLLGQAALNDYDHYNKSFYYNLIANSYGESNRKEDTYRKALEAFKLNLDSYEQLIGIYKEQQRTSAEWRALAEQIVDTYTYYPMAMTDLLRVIEPYLGNDDVIEIDMLKTEALNKAVKATDKEVLQSGACREIASELLGSSKVDLASFSFDGENAGKIVMNSKYDDYNFQVQYSLDGGNTWETTLDHQISLTEKEISSISAEHDIQVKISGSSQVFIIDILEGEGIESKTLAANDDENTFIGKVQNLECSTDGGKTWTDYTADLRFEGKVKVTARYKAHGTYLQGESTVFDFTEAAETETKRYIYVENISFVSAGTAQRGYESEHMIDASPYTTWHTKWGEVAQDKTYVVSLDKVRYLSQVTYDPAGLNGRIKKAKIYVSMDGKDWTLAGEQANLANNEQRKTIALKESMPARYVKVEAVETYGNHEGNNKYVSGTRFNYYEDSTKVFKEPEVEYSVTSWTNQDVTATLKVPAGYTVIGDESHTFTENGNYTFTYKDIHDKEKTITAEVTWIDREAPTATVEYDITETTQFAVKAALKDFSEENVTILNADEDGSHTFQENGTFTFELRDKAGNMGYVTAEVTWIENGDSGKLEIDSEVYHVGDNGIIKNINANTSLEEFLKNINTNAGSIKLTRDGKETKVVATGSVLTLNDNVNYTLVVKGDLTGDGATTDADLAMLNKHLIDRLVIKDRITLLAADMNQDDTIDIVDLSVLNKTILKK